MVELHAAWGRLVRNGDHIEFVPYTDLEELRAQEFEDRVTKLEQELKYQWPLNLIFNTVVLFPFLIYTCVIWGTFNPELNFIDVYSNIQRYMDTYSTLDYEYQLLFLGSLFFIFANVAAVLYSLFIYLGWLFGFITTRKLVELDEN